MKCFYCNSEAVRLSVLCLDCAIAIHQRERARAVAFRVEWIAELKRDIGLLDEDGWDRNIAQSCRDYFLGMWPNFTPRKGKEQAIWELERYLGLTPTVPRWINLCPMSPEQGRAVNTKFEQLD